MKRNGKKRTPGMRLLAVLLSLAMVMTMSGFQVLAEEAVTEVYSEEAAAEPATEDAVLEAEEPQAVRAAAAPAIPAAARKLRREILVLFMISAPVFKMNLCI